MLTAALSLSGALVYGAADFLGGLATKRLGALLATAIAAVAGLVVMLASLPLLGGEWTTADLGWGALSGVVGSVAIALLYASLAIGPMSILSPLTALMSAVTPMLWGTLVGAERFGALGMWGLALALLAVVLVGFVPERGAVRPSARGLALAVGSGLAIGAYYIVISHTSDESGTVPLIANRVVSASLLFGAFAVVAVAHRLRRRSVAAPAVSSTSRAEVGAADGAPRGGPSAVRTAPPSVAEPGRPASARSALTLALFGGVLDAIANTLLLLGIRAGDLAVAAVLGAMYPAGTVILAALVLRERIAPVQWAGLALAFVAAGMLALA
ncbi:drug/metabolite transporter (DMT)-like permease [Agromyces flavus]|uniref:Drug/metabolite transporter (DMT)-like permease n=1 Tax=Agromyces flavus TaxID=589382 RepID=A0A1H1L8E1_9MICO|nr:EamA family transporter [Agromyces flavus]MCP2367473.1 drug/metabolite transporter (DMT)-like permease [Agromyces flavus]GGI45661.1 multidrug transporter [Agromyces flavus]SDR70871.1 EamA-like transporter family protein [Agromyces flavus]